MITDNQLSYLDNLKYKNGDINEKSLLLNHSQHLLYNKSNQNVKEV